MNGENNIKETAEAVISQQDDQMGGDSPVAVFTMKVDDGTTYIIDKDENGYSDTGTDTRFKGVDMDTAVAFAKEWYVANYDNIESIGGDEDFIQEVMENDPVVGHYTVKAPREFLSRKGLHENAKIEVGITAMGESYLTRNGRKIREIVVDEPEVVKPESKMWAEYETMMRMLERKLPLGKSRVDFTFEDIVEYVNSIDDIFTEKMEQLIRDVYPKYRENADRQLRIWNEEMGDLSWDFTRTGVVVRGEKGEKVFPLGNYDGFTTWSNGIYQDILEEVSSFKERETERKRKKLAEEREKVKRDFIKALNEAIEICQEEPPATEDDFKLDFYEDTEYIKTIHFNGNEYPVKKYTDITPYSICYLLGKKDRYIQMTEIRKLTNKIEERKKAMKIAEESGLTKQMEKHREYIDFYERKKVAYEAGYTDTLEWDSDEYERTDIEEYNSTIPVTCMEKFKEARDSGVFDRFEIWEEYEDDDPMIVGVIEVNRKREFFEICEW